MKIVADTNCFLAVALRAPERDAILERTVGCELVAPAVLPFEIGNALTAMLKRGSLQREQILPAWAAAQAIPVALRTVDIGAALAIASHYQLYAYDAYFLECALSQRLPLLTLDRGMRHTARQLAIPMLELRP